MLTPRMNFIKIILIYNGNTIQFGWRVTMGEDNSTTLYFYLSKVKSVLFVIAGFVFAPGGIAMCYTAFKNEDYLMWLLGGAIAIFSTISIPVFLKYII